MKEEIPVPMTTESEFKPTLQECTPVESDYSQTIKTRTKSVSTSTCISAWSGAQSSQEEGNKGKVALAQTLGSTNVDDDEAKEKPVINKSYQMQSPWLFFSPQFPLAQPPPTGGGKGIGPGGHGLIPLTMQPGPGLLSPPPGNPFSPFPPHHHHPHPSQLLLAAAAAAAYGQQCATLLHHPRQQVPPKNFHLKMEEGIICPVKRKSPGEDPEHAVSREIKKAKLETKALKAKRPGFTDERYNETSYYTEHGLRKVYPYYFTFTTFTKGRWVGEKILEVFAREFRAHPVEEYERCIKSGTLTVNYMKVDTDYRLKHNDLLANIVHRHEVPVTGDSIEVIHEDEDIVVVNKPASIPVHPCGRYRHNTVVFILAKEHQLKNLRTIHRLDRLTSGLLLFGKTPKKAREMEHQIRNRLVQKEYVCRVEGDFPDEEIECAEPIEVVSYKIGVCKVSKDGKDCRTIFKKLSFNGKTSVVIARPKTGRMHQIRVHLQFLGYPIVNDPLYNHPVFGPEKGKGGITGKSDEDLIAELISIHNAENWLGIEGEEAGGPAGLDIFGPSHPLPARSTDNSSPTQLMDGPSDSNSDMNGTAMELSKTSPGESSSSFANAEEEHSSQTLMTAVSSGKVTVGTQTVEQEPTIPDSSNAVNVSSQLPTCSSSITENVEDSGEQQDASFPSASSSVNSSCRGRATESTFKAEHWSVDPHCYECKVKYRDPKPKDLVMYLHALSYRGPGWCYETKHPSWAEPDWVEDSS